jgi:hypothetical protein
MITNGARSGEGRLEDSILALPPARVCPGPWAGGSTPRLAGYFSPIELGRYHAEVFGIAGRRITEATVALFALLGFAFVPLGQKTAFEHTLAIFSTPAAKAAFRELGGTILTLRDRIIDAATPPKAPENRPKPELPKLPEATEKAR